LQEPLRKIQTFTELVNRNLSNEKSAQRYLEKIDASAHRMSNLIKSILTYSKISKADTKQQKIDLNKVLEDVKEDFELLIEEKNASITCGSLPTVNGDPLQLHQLFSNLLSNAIKFSESNPRISIEGNSLTKSEAEDLKLDSRMDYVKLVFADNGIGFEDEYKTRVFDMFQRLNNQDNYEGTGIGLALCKKIVENHGGRISAESKPGKGSTFTILLSTNPNG
jgi:signal transduction histidine kinase